MDSKIRTCFNSNSSKPLPVLKSPRENEMKQVGFAVVFSGPQQSLGNKHNQTPQWKYPESMNQMGEQKHKNRQPNSTPLSSCFSYPPPPRKKIPWKIRNSGNSKNSTLEPFWKTPKPSHLNALGIQYRYHRYPKYITKTIQTIIFWGCNPIVAKHPFVAKYITKKNIMFCYPFLKLLGV